MLSIQPAINFLAQILLLPYYAHFLGLENVGKLIAVMVVNNVVVALVDFNLLTPVMRLYKKASNPDVIIHSFIILKLIVVAFIALGVFVWLGFYESDSSLIWVYLLFVLASIVHPFHFDWVFIAENKIKQLGAIKGFQSIGFLVCAYGLIPLFPFIITVPIIGFCLSLVTLLYMIFKFKPKLKLPFKHDYKIMRGVFLEALPIAAMQFIAPFGVFFGVVALQKYSSDPDLVGPYGLGQKLALSLLALAHPLILTLINKLIQSKNILLVKNYTYKMAGFVLLLAPPVILFAPIVIEFFFKFLIPFDDKKIALTKFVAQFFLFIAAIMYLRVPAVSFLLGRGYTKLLAVIHVVPIVCAFGFTVHFAEKNNPMFVAYACGSSEIITTVLAIGLILVNKKSGSIVK